MPRFQPRIRKQKARRRAEVESPSTQNGQSNAAVLLPEEQQAQRAKRTALKAELQAGQPKFSRKKQKRLDKYIENKLRKEESLVLLKKIAANQVDTSLLRSSRSLGAGQGTKRDAALQRLKEEKAGVLLHRRNSTSSDGDVSPNLEAIDVESEWSGLSDSDSTGDLQGDSLPQNASVLAVGSGLKRPLELDSGGNPIIKKRQRTNTQLASMNLGLRRPFAEDSLSESQDTSDGSSLDSSDSSHSGSESDSDDSDDERRLSSALFAIRDAARSKERELEAIRRADAKATMDAWHNEALGIQQEPSHLEALSKLPSVLKAPKLRPVEDDPLPPSLRIDNPESRRQAYYVPVNRPPKVQESRLKLSIVAEEQKIMEAIHNHSVVIVCGATGSGKTTQVPQFLLEAGYGNAQGPTPGLIGVTQPRRVAAVAMAKRVAEELGDSSAKVSYQIRFDSTVDHNTTIKFMTDGILIREVANDFALTKYSAIIIDEAHERSVNTDILIGMVSRIVDLRMDMSMKDSKIKPLKLIIMSATLMTDVFTTNKMLFKREEPPLVEAEGRQFEVVEHFARRTQRDYIEQAYQKITRGHRKLPPGSMLVFLTGQNEISTLSKRLKRAFGTENRSEDTPKIHVSGKDVPLETEDIELGEDRVEDYGVGDNDTGESEDEGFDLDDEEPSSSRALILPLYSQLSTREQLRVFEPPPGDTRLIILATNVAETSITIPGIRYVFDCGRSKQKRYDKTTGVQSFEIDWISKASAKQRMGRAGRTGPGHCYRLYSSALYEAQFAEHSEPEILSTPIESVVLQLKSMDLQHVANFPFPTPPAKSDITQAEHLLGNLGALDDQYKITSVGRALSLYPISPRYAKMLAIGHQHDCIYLTTALVAALATPELFISEVQLDLQERAFNEDSGSIYDQTARLVDDAQAERRRAYNAAHTQFSSIDPSSDALKCLAAFCAYLWTLQSSSAETPEEFCSRNFVRAKGLAEAAQLYRQLLAIVALNQPGSCDPRRRTALKPPTSKQAAALKQFVAAAFLDQLAIRADLAPSPPSSAPRSRRATDVPYLTLFPSHDARAHRPTTSVTDGTPAEDDPYVYIHASSVLARRRAAELPPFLVYRTLQRSAPRKLAADGTPVASRTRLLPLAPTTAAQVSSLARGTPLLAWSKPVGTIEPLAAPAGRERRAVWLVPSIIGPEGTGARRSWPLPAVKVIQSRIRGGSWREEKRTGDGASA